MPDIKTELKIPDLWYDFYARFLPGTAFVAVLYILWPGTSLSSWAPTASQTMILAVAGYVCAFVSQPVSSVVTGWIHLFVAGGKDCYVKRIAEKLKPHEGKILSKMHGETTFFTQCFFLSLALWIMQLVPRFKLVQEQCLTIGAAIAFLALAFLVAYRRRKRAEDRLKFSSST